MIAWVRGTFSAHRGALTLDEEDLAKSSVEIEIDAASIDTREEQRDAHLRNADFFDTEKYPSIRYRSTSASRSESGSIRVTGELTIRGITREVTFDTAWPLPSSTDPWGNTRIAVSAALQVNRKDFGLSWNATLEKGGYLVGEEIYIEADIQFVKAGRQ